MNKHRFCCLLISGWLGKSGKGPYREDDEGRGPDYVIALLNEIERLGGLIVSSKSDADQSGLPYFELHLEVQLPRAWGVPRILVLLEDKYIRPQNFLLIKKNYDKIFTWDPDLSRRVGGDLYTFPAYFSPPPIGDYDKRKTLLCMIASNKGQTVHTRKDLYPERRKFLQWYEDKHPDHFVYYGSGWNLPNHPSGFLAKVIFKLFKKLNFGLHKKRLCWKGRANSKLEVLKVCKFNLCFENNKGTNGYITEKIFDAFSCGTIPIYWGAPNILDFVPSNCFIDYRQFMDIRKLHDHIVSMSKDDYTKIQENIAQFQKDAEVQFSIERFKTKLAHEILKPFEANS